MLPPWLVVVLLFLSVHRVSRFIGQDTFPPVAWVRTRLVRNKAPEHWLIYLIGDNTNTGCPWCISIYVGAVGAALTTWAAHWHWWVAVLLWLAASTVTGLISQLED